MDIFLIPELIKYVKTAYDLRNSQWNTQSGYVIVQI